MSTEVQKATDQAVQAARQSEQYALVLAAVQAVQDTQPTTCQHPAPAQPVQVGKWLALGAGGAVLGIAFALSAMAVAVSAVALTICVLVLRAIWQDTQRKEENR